MKLLVDRAAGDLPASHAYLLDSVEMHASVALAIVSGTTEEHYTIWVYAMEPVGASDGLVDAYVKAGYESVEICSYARSSEDLIPPRLGIPSSPESVESRIL